MNYEEISEQVINWAQEKGILQNSTPLKQLEKTQEELNETKECLEQLVALKDTQEQKKFHFAEDEDIQTVLNELKKEIGDQIVTLTLLSELVGFNTVDCFEAAYKKIKNRTGVMKDGFFVKDSA